MKLEYFPTTITEQYLVPTTLHCTAALQHIQQDRDEELSFLKDERVNRKVARPRLLVDTLRTRFYHGEYTILFQLLQHNHYCKH